MIEDLNVFIFEDNESICEVNRQYLYILYFDSIELLQKEYVIREIHTSEIFVSLNQVMFLLNNRICSQKNVQKCVSFEASTVPFLLNDFFL